MNTRQHAYIFVCLFTIGATAVLAHGDEDHMGGMKQHMQHMEQTKSWLRQKLGKQYDVKLPQATESQRAEGKGLFLKNCVPCHGTEGKGDGPAAAALVKKPADLTDPEHSAYYSDRGRIYIITNGIPETPMAGWTGRMTDEQIRAVYSFVVSLRRADEDGHHEHAEHDHAE